MICTPVDAVGVLIVLSRSLVTTVEFVDTAVIGTLASEVNSVMFGFTVLSTLLTVFGFVVVFLRRFLVVWPLETAVTVVGVVDSPFEVILEEGKVTFRARLGVVFGALVVRAVLFLKVLLTVRIFFRLVKVVTLLRVGVTLGVLGLLRVTGVGVV